MQQSESIPKNENECYLNIEQLLDEYMQLYPELSWTERELSEKFISSIEQCDLTCEGFSIGHPSVTRKDVLSAERAVSEAKGQLFEHRKYMREIDKYIVDLRAEINSRIASIEAEYQKARNRALSKKC